MAKANKNSLDEESCFGTVKTSELPILKKPINSLPELTEKVLQCNHLILLKTKTQLLDGVGFFHFKFFNLGVALSLILGALNHWITIKKISHYP